MLREGPHAGSGAAVRRSSRLPGRVAAWGRKMLSPSRTCSRPPQGRFPFPGFPLSVVNTGLKILNRKLQENIVLRFEITLTVLLLVVDLTVPDL